MKHAIAKIFRRITADEVCTEQLTEAERGYLEHFAAAEMHAAMAAAYKGRIDRLKAVATVAQLRTVHSQES
jgi:hypothetical protein